MVFTEVGDAFKGDSGLGTSKYLINLSDSVRPTDERAIAKQTGDGTDGEEGEWGALTQMEMRLRWRWEGEEEEEAQEGELAFFLLLGGGEGGRLGMPKCGKWEIQRLGGDS